MAIMRSVNKTGGGASWLGIKTGTFSKIVDESNKFDWADVYLVAEFQVEGSQYPRVLKIAGAWDRDAEGNIIDCSLLKRLTFFLDAMGEMGGVNQKGEWVDEDEKPVEDFCAHMNKYEGTECTIYVFREKSKNGKLYTRIHNKILKKGADSEKNLEGYIEYLKKNGWIKEASEEDAKTPVAKTSEFSAEALEIANL